MLEFHQSEKKNSSLSRVENSSCNWALTNLSSQKARIKHNVTTRYETQYPVFHELTKHNANVRF